MRRRILLGAVALAVALAAAAGGYYLWVEHASRNIVGSSTVEFVPATPPPRPPPRPKGAKPNPVVWPMYGEDEARLHVAAGSALAPPFRRLWTFHARSLVEFPPAIAYGRLYFANNAGVLYAVSAKTGKRAWRYRSGHCQAMSPAVGFDTVYAAFLNRPPCNAATSRGGMLVALWAGSGRVRWQHAIGPSESSPLLHDGLVYVGDWDGNVSAYAAGTGVRRWTYHAGGQVKGGLAYANGLVYFGAYDSDVYALDAATGKLAWKAAGQPRLGHSGTFYATPAVAYDRVYIGSTDGKVYSFGARSGEIRWSHSTGGYVYSSAAVWRERVYVGSYDGSFYCFDAATGDVDWTFDAGGPISGSPTVLAGRVYFSTLAGRTYALDARTGKRVWTFPDGKYSPVVADAHTVYLVGYARVYALRPRLALR